MNRLLPLAHISDETCQIHLGDNITGKHNTLLKGMEYEDADKQETVLTFLSYA